MSELILTKQGSPSNPAAGKIAFYLNAAGVLVTRDETGAEVLFPTAAQAAAINAATQAALSTFQNQYMGPLAVAPTKRPDNSALQIGDLYFDTATGMRVNTSTGWASAGSSVNGTAKRGSITATAGQTVFPIPGGFDSGFIDVYLDGAKLVNGQDVTVTASPNVTLAIGALAGQILDYVAYGTFVVANTYDQVTIDAKMNALQYRNRIINGDMRVNQRSWSSAAIAANSVTYTMDRWKVYCTQASKLSVGSGGVDMGKAIAGSLFVYIPATGYTPLATDQFVLYQTIEGVQLADLQFGTPSARTLALSFLVYCTVPGTYSGALRVDIGNNTSRSYVFSYTISPASASNWTPITVLIAGDQTNNYGLANFGTNAGAMDVMFNLGDGTNFTTAPGAWSTGNLQGVAGGVNLVSNAGASFGLTNVQLEVANAASAFERRPLSIELAMCMRYYQTLTLLFSAYQNAGGAASLTYMFPVTMRAPPSVGIPTPGYSNASNLTATSIQINFLVANINITSTGSGLVNGAGILSAEL